MPSAGKDPVVNKYRVAQLRREIKRMQNLLTHKKNLNLVLRFKIKICKLNLVYELRRLT
jgi:hypothetical protein